MAIYDVNEVLETTQRKLEASEGRSVTGRQAAQASPGFQEFSPPIPPE